MILPESCIVRPSRSKYLLGHERTIRKRLHADSAIPLPKEYEARAMLGLLGSIKRK